MTTDREQDDAPGEGDNFDPPPPRYDPQTGELLEGRTASSRGPQPAEPEPEPEEDGEPISHSFAIFATQVRDGEINAELSDLLGGLLDELAKRAELGGVATGELKIGFKFKMDNRGVVIIKHDADIKLPKLKTAEATMWVGRDGRLSPENPRQQKLPLRAVEAKRTRKQVDVSRARRSSLWNRPSPKRRQ